MSSIEILALNPIEPFVLDLVSKNYKLHRLWESKDTNLFIAEVAPAILYLLTSAGGMTVDGAFMARFPNLKGIVNFGVGYDAIDTNWAREHGLIVTHTPDVLNDEVADLALGLTLSVIRQIPQADRFVHDGRWGKDKFPLSSSLKNRTMGILGLGRIGKAIAKRAEAFGLKIAYHGRHKQDGVAFDYFPTLVDLARASDILMLVAPGTAETRHIVNKDVLSALGPQGFLINIARGSLVDDDALIDALEQKTILSAAMDVYAHEPNIPPRLLALPNLVLTPHVGSLTEPTRRAMGELVLENLDALVQGRRPPTPVPETPIA